jgi:phage protein D
MNAETDAKTDLVAVTIAEDLEAPSMFTLQFVNRNLKRGKVTWVDSDLLDIGGSVEIGMTYEGTPATLFSGEITGLEPEFSKEDASMLIVRGYDLRHRLMRGRKTKSFTKMKDSAIASQIAAQANLIGKVTDTGIVLEYVLQHNQTDLEFLQDRAKRIGYEVVVENKTLFFRPYQHTTGKVLTLTSGQDFSRFSPRLSSMNQVGEVEVRGWDFKQKQALVGQCKSSERPAGMGGTTSGAKQTVRAFSIASNVVVTQPVASAIEAKKMAQGQFDGMALNYITGDGECRGNPKIRAGRVIEIAGIGKRFSGLYYVTATNHTYRKREGYQTQFTVRRNAT